MAGAPGFVLVALVGVGWLLSRADEGAAGWLEVGVGACEGVVWVLEAGDTSCLFDERGGMLRIWGGGGLGTLMKLAELRLNTRSCSIMVPFLRVDDPPPLALPAVALEAVAPLM